MEYWDTVQMWKMWKMTAVVFFPPYLIKNATDKKSLILDDCVIYNELQLKTNVDPVVTKAWFSDIVCMSVFIYLVMAVISVIIYCLISLP